jgi:hypothetical protein
VFRVGRLVSGDLALRNFRGPLINPEADCVFQIRELNSVPLKRLVFVVDETTDRQFLNRTLEDSYSDLRSDSPNQGVPLSVLQLFEFQSRGYGEIEHLLEKLCTAALIRNGN